MDGIYHLEGIGNTGQQALKKIPKHCGLKSQIHAKLECGNPFGSIYDRLSLALVNKAEGNGGGLITTPDGPLVFGPDPEFCLSLLHVCNAKGYKLIALLDGGGKMTSELKHFGATVVHFEEEKKGQLRMLEKKASALQSEIEGAVNLVDLVARDPTIFHEAVDHLLKEILSSGITPNILLAELDGFGIIQRIREKLLKDLPSCQVFGVSSEIFPAREGSGSFPPENVVDVGEKGAFRYARDLNVKEDLYVGARSGAVIAGAVKVLSEKLPEKGKDPECILLALLPDHVRHSNKSFLSVDFMREKGYMSEGEFNSLYWWYLMGVGNVSCNTLSSVEAGVSLPRAAALLKLHPRLLVWKISNHQRNCENVLGILTEEVLRAIDAHKKKINDPSDGKGQILLEYSNFLTKFGTIDCRGLLGDVDRLLQTHPAVLIYNDVVEYGVHGEEEGGGGRSFKTPLAIVTVKEVQAWIYSVEEHHRVQYGWEPGAGYMKEEDEHPHPHPPPTDLNTNPAPFT